MTNKLKPWSWNIKSKYVLQVCVDMHDTTWVCYTAVSFVNLWNSWGCCWLGSDLGWFGRWITDFDFNPERKAFTTRIWGGRECISKCHWQAMHLDVGSHFNVWTNLLSTLFWGLLFQKRITHAAKHQLGRSYTIKLAKYHKQRLWAKLTMYFFLPVMWLKEWLLFLNNYCVSNHLCTNHWNALFPEVLGISS